jgi:hypothetical protein
MNKLGVRIGGYLTEIGKPGESSFEEPRPTLGCRATDDDDDYDGDEMKAAVA